MHLHWHTNALWISIGIHPYTCSYTSMASNIRNRPITPGLLYLHPATVSTQPRDWAANLTTLWSQPCQSSSGKLSSDPVQSFSEHASNFFIVFVAQLSPLSL